MTRYILIAGTPGAGKSTLADRIEAAGRGYTHVPLDRYIKPVPTGYDFLDWVRKPVCIDWSLLHEHLQILRSGTVCYSPRPDWSDGGRRSCVGGALEGGPGRRMESGQCGYLIPGTHAFSFRSPAVSSLKIHVETPDQVIASRLAGQPVPEEGAAAVLDSHLGPNLSSLRALEALADASVSGIADPAAQLRAFDRATQALG